MVDGHTECQLIVDDRYVDHGRQATLLEVTADGAAANLELVHGIPAAHRDGAGDGVAPLQCALRAAQNLDLPDVPQRYVAEHHLVVAERAAVHLHVEARPRAGQEGVGALRRAGAVQAAHRRRQITGADAGHVGNLVQQVVGALDIRTRLQRVGVEHLDAGRSVHDRAFGAFRRDRHRRQGHGAGAALRQLLQRDGAGVAVAPGDAGAGQHLVDRLFIGQVAGDRARLQAGQDSTVDHHLQAGLPAKGGDGAGQILRRDVVIGRAARLGNLRRLGRFNRLGPQIRLRLAVFRHRGSDTCHQNADHSADHRRAQPGLGAPAPNAPSLTLHTAPLMARPPGENPLQMRTSRIRILELDGRESAIFTAAAIFSPKLFLREGEPWLRRLRRSADRA